MIYSIKTELMLSKENERVLDGQSKILNYVYNELLAEVNQEYNDKGKDAILLKKYNLRNRIPQMKKEKPFLQTLHSSPLKNAALRLKQSFMNFFKVPTTGHPKFSSWKNNWFSLYYDEPNKGIHIDNNHIKISLGKDINGKRLYVNGILSIDTYYEERINN